MSLFKEIIHPPKKWKLFVVISVGIITGLALYLFRVSNAVSYLSDEPETCINCHVMIPEYATWNHSSHREYAGCNDCHVPHTNFVHKYYFKAADGLRHATVFTLRNEPEVIQIKEAGKEVVQNNCIRCHTAENENVSLIHLHSLEEIEQGAGNLCWECHREVPHGKVHSLSSTPDAFIPEKEYTVPEWLTKWFETENEN